MTARPERPDTPRVAITGGYGFLGWHTACRLRAANGSPVLRIGREDFDSTEVLAQRLNGVDTIIHLAGVNRADSDDEVEQGNIRLAEALTSALAATSVAGTQGPHVVYANSVQSRLDTPYGRGKAVARDILRSGVHDVGGSFADVVLPNVFGEHGRPAYNSFVATFCYEVAAGRQPSVTGDREIPLLHAQDAAGALLDAAGGRHTHQVEPTGELHGVREVLDLINGFHRLYVDGEVPDLRERFVADLFNTYRSYLVPWHYPIQPKVHEDARGRLLETVRAHGGQGQSFVSTTVPGAVRGNHYHLRKVERFTVVSGEAEICLRRLFYNKTICFRVSGRTPGSVDMPTMWVHNIRNVGEGDLVTLFWANQLLDPANPDQYPEPVDLEVAQR